MKYSTLLRGGAACVAMSFIAFAPAYAQQTPASGTAASQSGDTTVVVVSGIRNSLKTAQDRKRTSEQVMDSIVADDIGKLPDLSVVDALQRVSGVIISRDRGEGKGASIRGLGSVLSTIDGREAFTADGGRGYNLQDMPSELLGAVDVYKSPQASQIEGGVTGIIDMRTRMPFDFKGQVISGSLRLRYNDLADKTSPVGSLLYSNRWHTPYGDMGFLVAAVDQYRDFRSDNPGWNAATSRSDLVAGQNVYVLGGSFEPLIIGQRHRPGISTAFQWRPKENLEVYAQAGYQQFSSYQQQYGINNQLGAPNTTTNTNTVVPGTVVLFPGTNDLKSATFNNMLIDTFADQRDTLDTNLQYAVGVKWTKGHHRITADFSYIRSSNDLYFTEISFKATVPQAKLDMSLPYPSVTYGNFDATNPANFQVDKLTGNVNHYLGDAPTFRIDDDITFDNSFFTHLKVGYRASQRNLTFKDVVRFSKSAIVTNLASVPDLWMQMPIDNFISSDAATTHKFIVANPAALKWDNFDVVRGKLGVTTPVTISTLSLFDIHEKTKAAYVEGVFAHDGTIHFDGNLGVRVVETNLLTNGYKSTGGTLSPYSRSASYKDVLPSANLRFYLSDDVQLRFAASQTLTRPTTQQLSPSYTLNPGPAQGSGGNPDLKPLHSTGLDMTVEDYFSHTGSAYFALFRRHVKDFIFTSTTSGVLIDGISYTISSPVNGRYGDVNGYEIGGQTFFDQLPGLWSGFGIQANYTHVNSETDQVIPGSKTELPGIPKDTYAASLLYEKGKFGARLAYTHRSTVFTGIYNSPSNAIGVGRNYAVGYGWLDGSVSYQINDHWSITGEASNIDGTVQINNNGGPTRPSNWNNDDRQFLVGLRFKY